MTENCVENVTESNQNNDETKDSEIVSSKASPNSKSKRNKNSLFNRFLKKFSGGNRKSKNTSDDIIVENSQKCNSNNDVNHSADNKENKRFSGMRLSFGKGKSAGKSSGDDKHDDVKLKEQNKRLSQNNRPQSMHINPNLQPPRYGYLAGFGWYWGPLSRAEATYYLRNTENGSFLVRDSEGDPNKFTLSFKGAGHIFHNRILRINNKYAFLPDEEFDSIPDLIENATKRSRTSAYCFSRSADKDTPIQATSSAASGGGTNETNIPSDPDQSASPNPLSALPPPLPAHSSASQLSHHNNTSSHDNNNINSLSKHEVRLLYPISRYEPGQPRSLLYLCRFLIRQYCTLADIDSLTAQSITNTNSKNTYSSTEELVDFIKQTKFYL